MTDKKEIIINSIDVAGCEHHLSTGYCQLQMIFQSMVLKLPFGKHLECNLCDKDCYYKQLKRLEQENNLLKQTLKDKNFVAIVEENERLKEELEKIRNNKCVDCISHLISKNHKKALIKASKVLKTLQEIKEIADALSCKHPEDCFENKPDWNGEVYGCDVADNWKEPSDLATCPSKLASAILQIITKAESEG